VTFDIASLGGDCFTPAAFRKDTLAFNAKPGLVESGLMVSGGCLSYR
jgi:hypothetical protein